MSTFNSPSEFSTPPAPKAPSRKLVPVLLGGLFLATVCGIGSLSGGSRDSQASPQSSTAQYNAVRSSDMNEDGPSQNESSENAVSSQDTGVNGNMPQSSVTSASGDPAPDTSGDAIDNGYEAREKVNDQAAQANDGEIRDTDTVRDTEDGQVYTNVPNAEADPAIQSGAVTEVPTSELPTSGDSSTASAPDTSSSEASSSDTSASE